MEKGVVTICIVNYKTLDLTRLCLQSIHKYTSYPYKVIVVDNDSQDASTEYLKTLPWIKYVNRPEAKNDESGVCSHAGALDLGLELCDTEFFMAMHSDTFIHKQGWLTNLVNYFVNDSEVVCVGCGKCELTVAWREFVKKISDFKTFKRKLLRTPDPIGIYRYYNRSVCSIYRTEILKKENLAFLMDHKKGLTVGKKLYFELVDRGYKTVELPDHVMVKYLWHLAHATQVINENEFKLRTKTLRKTKRLMDRIMNSKEMQEILNDNEAATENLIQTNEESF